MGQACGKQERGDGGETAGVVFVLQDKSTAAHIRCIMQQNNMENGASRQQAV
jgi:hypothetical protein